MTDETDRTGGVLYAWQVFDDDGQWGVMAVKPFGTNVLMPLVCRKLSTAHRFGLLAVQHHDATGLPVRLVRFDNVAVLREVP